MSLFSMRPTSASARSPPGALDAGRRPHSGDLRDEVVSRVRAAVSFARASDGSASRNERLVVGE